MKRGLARKAALGAAILLGATALVGCDVNPPEAMGHILGMGWPDPVTPEGQQMHNLWVWIWVAAWTIGVIMWALMLTAIIAWNRKAQERKGKGEFPKQLQYNVPLELTLTVIPALIVMVLFFFTAETQQSVIALDKNPKVSVDVTAFQWNWKFGYANVAPELTANGQDYVGQDTERQALADQTKYDPEGTKNGNPIHGKSLGDQSYLAFDKIETVGSTEEVPVLVLPSNTSVQFNLASADVSHGFWVPQFLFKRDVYAHPENNQQERSFQIASIEPGAYVGRCTEMCGTYHAMMNFEVRVVTPEEFKQYLQYRIDNPNASNADALASIGQAPYATTTKPLNSSRATRDGDNFIDPQNV